jgi:hypothetical protein
VFCDCTTKHSSPYSAENEARYLSKKYATEIEVVKVSKNVSPDGVKYNEYILKDKKRGFLFEAGSFVAMDRHIIAYYKKRWDLYSRDLMRFYHDDAMQIAGKYNVRFIPPLQELPVIPYRSRSLVRPFDSIFISSSAQMNEVIDLYTELANFYGFTYVRYHKNETKNPKLILSYLPEDEPDRSKSVKICHLLYLNYRIKKIPGYASEKDIPAKNVKYENYIPMKYEIRRILYNSWNKAVDNEKIAQEKIEYRKPKDEDSPFSEK